MQKTRQQIIEELNRFLLIDVCWDGLSEEDLSKLAFAFRKLRFELEEIFEILDEALIPIQDKGEWRNYTV